MGQFSNALQKIPYCFQEIIKNDNKQEELRSQEVVPFQEMKELIQDRQNLRSSAEKILRWNTDKGNTG